jgi:TPR repeat protein
MNPAASSVDELLLDGRYSRIPPATDPHGEAVWAFARYHLVADRQTAATAERAHQAGEALGAFVLLLCHWHGAGVLHDEDLANRLNYQLRTRLEQIEKPTILDFYMRSKCHPGDERGLTEASLKDMQEMWQNDPRQRWAWLNAAAQRSFAQACIDVGNAHRNAGKMEEACRWYWQAASLGSAEGKTAYGFLLGQGQGVARDQAREVELNRSAAEEQWVFAMINLGVFYDRGLGVAQDQSAAREWIDRAAATGHWAGFFEKGSALLRGAYGYPVDREGGLRLLQEGVKTGHADFLFKVAELYANGFGLSPSGSRAVRFAEAAFRQGNRRAAAGLANLYRKGFDDVSANEELWRFWTIQSNVEHAFSMGPKLEDSPLQRIGAIDPFAVPVE